jgi:hypothetical protein
VFVVLGGADRAQPTNRPGATDQPTEGYTPDPQEDRTAELIATLREQLAAERQAHAEARRLLMAALERIPAIEAPASGATDERGPHQTVEEEPGRAEDPGPGPQTNTRRRPWWRRWVFGE